MDDQTQQQNSQVPDPQQDDQNAQNAQNLQNGQNSQNGPSQTPQVQSGGTSPEAPMTQDKGESQPQKIESGYEKIKQIEKAAEAGAQKEQAPKPQPVQKPTPKPQPQPIIKKKKPEIVKPKYFGYQPPPSVANNTKYIKANAGKGNPKDSTTWLLLFLDRLLKKETEGN